MYSVTICQLTTWFRLNVNPEKISSRRVAHQTQTVNAQVRWPIMGVYIKILTLMVWVWDGNSSNEGWFYQVHGIFQLVVHLELSYSSVNFQKLHDKWMGDKNCGWLPKVKTIICCLQGSGSFSWCVLIPTVTRGHYRQCEYFLVLVMCMYRPKVTGRLEPQARTLAQLLCMSSLPTWSD